MGRYVFLLCLMILVTGCDDGTNLKLAVEAASDAVRAVTLSNDAVQSLANQASQYSDQKNKIAPADNRYAKRLSKLVGSHVEEEGITFNFKVYLSPDVNAFAMADGTIRMYKGLMDMMDDHELRFVVGHEMGHVIKKHIRKKMRLAYASSALRKGIASQDNVVGDIARSWFGDFAEKLINAQFSQQEEREADDFGIFFLKQKGYPPAAAVSALRKLSSLGSAHSFLSSHPAPDKRAERLGKQL